jgi:TonB family protein
MLSFAILVTLRATVLLAVVLVCLALMKNRAASVRALICVVALAGTILLPFVSWASPSWAVVTSVPIFTTAAAAMAGASAPSGIPWRQALAAVWLAGALVIALRWLGGWWLSVRVRRHSERLDESELRALAIEAGVNPDRIELRLAEVSSPVACGLLRPAILVPREAANWDAFRRRVVLMHELAHLQRGDVWANLLAVAARAMFWFHPLAWVIGARLWREQELACDDAVLGAGVPAASYADILLDSARGLPNGLLFGCPMAASRGAQALRGRFAHLFAVRARGVASPWLIRSMMLVLPVALVLVSAIRPLPAEEVHKIGGDIAAPHVVYKVEPQYTQAARDAKIDGRVVLGVVIGADGVPRDIEVKVSLDDGLDQNAVRAVEQWRFDPAKKKDEPVAVWATIEVNFRLK